MPSNQDISIYRGQDIDLSFTMSPVEDISGWDIEFNLRGVGVLVTVAATIDDGTDGIFVISLLDTHTDALTPGIYDYDVWRTDADVEFPLAIGKLTLLGVARDVEATT